MTTYEFESVNNEKRASALKRALRSVLALLSADQVRKAEDRTIEFFEKYGTDEERHGFADFHFAVKSHESSAVSANAARIEMAAYVGALQWWKAKPRRKIVPANEVYSQRDLELRLRSLLGEPGYRKGDVVGQQGWKVVAILNEKYPERVFHQGGYVYRLEHPDGRSRDAYEREIVASGTPPTAFPDVYEFDDVPETQESDGSH